MEEILRKLQDKNYKAAYEFTKQIGAESIVSDKYSGMIPAFAEMLRDKSSYVRTRGFVAMGLNARGVIAVGLKAKGIVTLGILSAGCYSIGVFAIGAISLGIISLGAIAIGDFSVGALPIGKYFALGDNARAMIALGDTKAAGSVFQKIGELSTQDITAVKHSLDTIVPAYLSWAKEIITLFL